MSKSLFQGLQEERSGFVEQKNEAVVRRLVGYGRFEGIDAARPLARLFAAARLYINFLPRFVLEYLIPTGAFADLSCQCAFPPEGVRVRPE
ncbi:hypothetical protein [Bradyrhizobium vignae]|uniref:hypothetical protein n=1 Tax=Bradyrhizobium vignae TaxID=1549949 RepID=UPI00100A71B3|nr:hypothetical protein [Bradyrhizobium vignae]RXG83552.1 hypothetical protein EAV90_39050 [Bradyrhizobium vignae]